MDPLDAHVHDAMFDGKALVDGDVTTAISLLPALLVFSGAGIGLGLTVYYIISLSDLTEDLINPHTFCERVNSTVHFELIAHAVVVLALIGNPIALCFAAPTLALRGLWWHRKTLVADPTTCFRSESQASWRNRWFVMLAWHAVAGMFGFVQLILHAALSVPKGTAALTGSNLYSNPHGAMHFAAAMHGL